MVIFFFLTVQRYTKYNSLELEANRKCEFIIGYIYMLLSYNRWSKILGWLFWSEKATTALFCCHTNFKYLENKNNNLYSCFNNFKFALKDTWLSKSCFQKLHVNSGVEEVPCVVKKETLISETCEWVRWQSLSSYKKIFFAPQSKIIKYITIIPSLSSFFLYIPPLINWKK